MKRIVILLMAVLLPGVGRGTWNRPDYLYSTSTDIASARSTAVLDYESDTVAAFTGRSKNVLSVSPPVFVRSTTKVPMAVDQSRGVCIFGTVTGDSGSTSTELHTSADGSSYTKIADRTAAPFSTYNNRLYFYSVWVLSDNSYLVNYGAHIFKSTNGGTTWVDVKDIETTSTRCFTNTYQPKDLGKVLIGGYGSYVWESLDYGDTWTKIYTLPDANNVGTSNHIHTAIYDPTDYNRVYVSNGDNANQCLRVIEKTGETWAATWEIPEVSINPINGTVDKRKYSGYVVGMQPTGAISDSTYIYWTPDSGHGILRQNMATNRLTEVYKHANAKRSSTTALLSDLLYYDDEAAGGYAFGVTKVGGLYYICFMLTTPPSTYDTVKSSRVVVTTDFITFADWITKWDFTDAYDGWQKVVGSIGDKLFISRLNPYDTDKYGDVYTVPSYSTKSAVLTSPAYHNYLTTGYNDSFENTGFSTTVSYNFTAAAASTDYALHGTKSLKLKLDRATYGYATYTGLDFVDAANYVPAVNDYIHYSAYIKTDIGSQDYIAAAADGTKVNFGNIQLGFSITGGTANTDYVVWVYGANGSQSYTYDGWYKASIVMKLLTETYPTVIRPTIRWNGYGEDGVAHYCYVDCAEVFVSQTFTPYNDKPFEIGSSTLSDYATIPLSLKGSVGTVLLHYTPNFESYSQQSGNHNILKMLTADGGYCDLYWSATDKKYYISDGTDSGASDNTAYLTCKENIWVAITYNLATPTATVYMYDAESQQTIVTTDVITSKPSAMILGHSGDIGLFDTVAAYDEELSSDDIMRVFSLSAVLVPQSSGGQSAPFGGGTPFGD